MAIEIPRRQFLRCLTGLIAAPAVIKASALMKVVALDDFDLAYDSLNNRFESYVSWFRLQPPFAPRDWRYVSRVVDLDGPALLTTAPRDLDTLEWLLALPSAQRC